MSADVAAVAENIPSVCTVVRCLAAAGGEFAGYIWTGEQDSSDGGSVWRCPNNNTFDQSNPDSPGPGCVKLDDPGLYRYPTSMVLGNGYLYVGLSRYHQFANYEDALMWRCEPWTQNSCTTFNQPGKNTIYSMAIGAGYLWAGLESNILWRCSLEYPDCNVFKEQR